MEQHRTDSGFTLVEMIVVLVIIGILTATAILAIRGPRQDTRAKQAVAVASAYSFAIEAYKSDHAGQAPVFGSRLWPTPTNPRNDTGPLNMLGRPYLRGGAPALVQDGLVRISTSAPTPSATLIGWVRYERRTTPLTAYDLFVYVKNADGNWRSTPYCTFTGGDQPRQTC